MNINEAKAEIEVLECQIKGLQDKKDKLDKWLLEQESPFKVGDVILWKRGPSMAKGKVIQLHRRWGDHFQWTVQRIKKDGFLGESCTVYDWTNPTKEHP